MSLATEDLSWWSVKSKGTGSAWSLSYALGKDSHRCDCRGRLGSQKSAGESSEATNAAAAEDTGATEVHLPVSTF